MRFFKSFRLLHRRTKSDGDVTAVLAAQSASRPVAQDLHTLPLHRISADYPALGNLSCGESSLFIEDISFAPPAEHTTPDNETSDRDDVFGHFSFETPPRSITYSVESETIALRNTNRTLKADLVEVTKEAADARSALHAHMTKNAYQEAQIRGLAVEFKRYQCIDGLLARVGLHKAVLDNALAVLEEGGNPADVIVRAIELANPKTETAPAASKKESSSSSSPIGPRSQEHYVAALNMTLNVRKELKGNKKVTKFWKRVAQEGGLNADVITPSPSNVSSIRESLSLERQKAVDALVARRRGSIAVSESKSVASVSTVEPAISSASTSENPLPTSASGSSTVSTLRVLPPLASDSIKQQLAQHGNNKRFAGSRSNSRPSVLRALDLNVPAPKRALLHRGAERRNVPVALPHRRYPSDASDSGSIQLKQKKARSDTTRSFVAALSSSLRRSKSARKEKASKRESQDSAEGSVPFDNTAFQPKTSSVPSDPSLSSRASTARNETPVNRRVSYEHGGSLGHISEESQSGFKDAEESFASTVPTTPAKTPKVLYESPSRLPVLKYIRRLSPLSSPMKGKAKKEKEKENAARASPSKLPRRAGPAQGSPRRAMFNPLMYSIA
ncbi:hypothetical protein FIBSPDRAFT_6474 [Athelia psychrophila]|uniref:Uncharacterized protein n=1 Tax=Athelia psychrophila TaxID=1759441 RepID=A0A166X2F5_9AGAM|nr:hypothetical protein FIBSPDRAFT_6474 [Fibularhizoctonia sp. CBS 109695]